MYIHGGVLIARGARGRAKKGEGCLGGCRK